MAAVMVSWQCLASPAALTLTAQTCFELRSHVDVKSSSKRVNILRGAIKLDSLGLYNIAVLRKISTLLDNAFATVTVNKRKRKTEGEF